MKRNPFKPISYKHKKGGKARNSGASSDDARYQNWQRLFDQARYCEIIDSMSGLDDSGLNRDEHLILASTYLCTGQVLPSIAHIYARIRQELERFETPFMDLWALGFADKHWQVDSEAAALLSNLTITQIKHLYYCSRRMFPGCLAEQRLLQKYQEELFLASNWGELAKTIALPTDDATYIINSFILAFRRNLLDIDANIGVTAGFFLSAAATYLVALNPDDRQPTSASFDQGLEWLIEEFMTMLTARENTNDYKNRLELFRFIIEIQKEALKSIYRWTCERDLKLPHGILMAPSVFQPELTPPKWSASAIATCEKFVCSLNPKAPALISETGAICYYATRKKKSKQAFDSQRLDLNFVVWFSFLKEDFGRGHSSFFRWNLPPLDRSSASLIVRCLEIFIKIRPSMTLPTELIENLLRPMVDGAPEQLIRLGLTTLARVIVSVSPETPGFAPEFLGQLRLALDRSRQFSDTPIYIALDQFYDGVLDLQLRIKKQTARKLSEETFCEIMDALEFFDLDHPFWPKKRTVIEKRLKGYLTNLSGGHADFYDQQFRCFCRTCLLDICSILQPALPKDSPLTPLRSAVESVLIQSTSEQNLLFRTNHDQAMASCDPFTTLGLSAQSTAKEVVSRVLVLMRQNPKKLHEWRQMQTLALDQRFRLNFRFFRTIQRIPHTDLGDRLVCSNHDQHLLGKLAKPIMAALEAI